MEPVGIPISAPIDNYNGIIKFKTELTFCHFNCALAFCLYRYPTKMVSDQPLTAHREQLLRIYHELLYPDSGQLIPSLDPELLICNGGIMTDEEYDINTKIYKRTVNVISEPNRVIYSRKI